MIKYKLQIKKECTKCGDCGNVLAGWPDACDGKVILSSWALEFNADVIDKVIESCPNDLIELVVHSPSPEVQVCQP